MKQFEYFVSYHTKSKIGGNQGFGSITISMDGHIDSAEALTDVQRHIQETLGQDYGEIFSVVILNFQLLREVPENDG